MKNRHWWPWLVVLVTAVFATLVVTDLMPLVRGPQGWRWSLNQSGLPWWPTLLAAALFFGCWWGLGHWLVQAKRQTAVPLALMALFLITLGLQAAQLTRFHPNPAAILYERLASDQASGYFSAAQEIEHLPTFLREFPERMQTFRADPHPRSKPPGIVLLYWGWEQILARSPSLADSIGHWARGVICNNLWLATRTNAALSANVVMGFLTPIFSALALFPAYLLANRFWGRRQAWLAAGLVAILPGRLIFAPHMDTVYPLFALLALWGVAEGVRRERPFLSFLGGLSIGIATFMSLINGLVAAVIGLFVVGQYLSTRNWSGIVRHGAAIFVGTFLLWAVYWAAFGVSMLEIYAAAAPARHDLERSYGVWLVGNVYDFAIFAGLGAFLLALPQSEDRSGKHTAVLSLLAAFWLTLLLFNLSGAIRGEVGRIWLMFAPFPALLAARLVKKENYWQMGTAILATTLLVTTAMAGRWQTTEVEWPIVPLSYEFATIPASATPLPTSLGENISLAAFEVTQTDQLNVTLYWETAVRPATPYTVFVHLLDSSGNIVAQRDKMPQDDTLPTTCWQPNSTIADTHPLDIATLSPGSYTLQVGLYDQQTFTRLGDAVQLSVIRIR